MARIAAEFSYWSYGQFSRTAMISRPEVDPVDIESMARRYAVQIHARPVSSAFFVLGRRPGWYRKVAISIIGEKPEEVRGCIREIILIYGRPDEVPMAFSPSKRAGRVILQRVIKDYPGR